MMPPKWKNSKKIVIGVVIVIIFLNILQFSIITSKNKNNKNIEKLYEKTYELIEESKKENESKYVENFVKLNNQIEELKKIREEDSKKLQNQLNKIEKKYEKEYNNVSNTTVDSTIIISQRQLSKEIDYSKFKRRY